MTPTLEYLQKTWSTAYEITEALGVWRAVRLDNQKTLIANRADELQDLIIHDSSASRGRRDGGVA